MEDSTSKEKILKKVRKALINKSSKEPVTNIDLDSNVFVESTEAPEFRFAQNFTEAHGKFVFCLDKSEVVENLNYLIEENNWSKLVTLDEDIQSTLKEAGIAFSEVDKDIQSADVGLSNCEYLVSRTGSIMISSKQASGRKLPFFSNVHIVFAYTSQLVDDIKDALKGIKSKYLQLPSMFTFITGPSRTADIEKTLVLGAHGPKDVYVFLIDDLGLE